MLLGLAVVAIISTVVLFIKLEASKYARKEEAAKHAGAYREVQQLQLQRSQLVSATGIGFVKLEEVEALNKSKFYGYNDVTYESASGPIEQPTYRDLYERYGKGNYEADLEKLVKEQFDAVLAQEFDDRVKALEGKMPTEDIHDHVMNTMMAVTLIREDGFQNVFELFQSESRLNKNQGESKDDK